MINKLQRILFQSIPKEPTNYNMSPTVAIHQAIYKDLFTNQTQDVPPFGYAQHYVIYQASSPASSHAKAILASVCTNYDQFYSTILAVFNLRIPPQQSKWGKLDYL